VKYLLDTHIFIWSLTDDHKLSRQVKGILEDVEDTSVSVVSLWEISLKFGLGKLELKGSTPEKLWMDSKKLNYRFLPLAFDEVISFHHLPKEHNDPFDRMLVWQAIKNNMILISNDVGLDIYEKLGLKIVR
jgi:PIN domain nuclease of toxin-antitoxin system